MTLKQKKRLRGEYELDIVLADLSRILSFQEDDMLFVYNNINYFDWDSNEKKCIYRNPLFAIRFGDFGIGDFISPKYALAKVKFIDHGDDGVFRVALDINTVEERT